MATPAAPRPRRRHRRQSPLAAATAEVAAARRSCQRRCQSSQSPLSEPESQLPEPESQLPAAETDIYPNVVYDLAPGVTGPVNKFMADTLNVGCHFVRLGGEGGGRCALSAFFNAHRSDGVPGWAAAQRRRRYDDKRKELRAMWEELNTDQRRPAVKKRKTSARHGGRRVVHRQRAHVCSAQTLEDRRERAWEQFGADLQGSRHRARHGDDRCAGTSTASTCCCSSATLEVRDFGAGTKAGRSIALASAPRRSSCATSCCCGRVKPGGAEAAAGCRWSRARDATSSCRTTSRRTRRGWSSTSAPPPSGRSRQPRQGAHHGDHTGQRPLRGRGQADHHRTA